MYRSVSTFQVGIGPGHTRANVGRIERDIITDLFHIFKLI